MAVRKMMLVCLMSLLAGTCLAQSCQDAVKATNDLRKLHGAKGLVWDGGLAAKAQANAKELAKNGCKMEGSKGGNSWACYGKNCGTCPGAVASWYQGKDAFSFKSPNQLYTSNEQAFDQWGTWSQLVWSSAQKVGCALVRGNNCAAVNCVYDAGNVVTDAAFKANVHDLVQQPTTQQPTTQQRTDTVGSGPIPPTEPRDCLAWATAGYCRENGPAYLMQLNGETKTVTEWCPQSCPSTYIHVDEQKQCQAWAQKGYCTKFGPLYLYIDPATSEVRDIASWCPASCPYTPPGSKPTNTMVARKMMANTRSQIYVPASEEQASTA